jgi:hypothetical protein
MTTTALQQLTIFIVRRLVVQVYSGERVVECCALVIQAEVYWFHEQNQSSNWGGGDLREAHVDVPLSVSHSCV